MSKSEVTVHFRPETSELEEALESINRRLVRPMLRDLIECNRAVSGPALYRGMSKGMWLGLGLGCLVVFAIFGLSVLAEVVL